MNCFVYTTNHPNLCPESTQTNYQQSQRNFVFRWKMIWNTIRMIVALNICMHCFRTEKIGNVNWTKILEEANSNIAFATAHPHCSPMLSTSAGSGKTINKWFKETWLGLQPNDPSIIHSMIKCIMLHTERIGNFNRMNKILERAASNIHFR